MEDRVQPGSRVKITIRKTGWGNEFAVRLWKDGKQIASYFTDDKADAKVTSKYMLAEELRKETKWG